MMRTVAIKEDILEIIEKKKDELSNLKQQLDQLTLSEEEDKKEFLEFAFSFIQDTGRHFLEPYITKEYRMACKQMLFPAGIYINPDGKVYTPRVSAFYRGGVIKKDAEASDNSHLVRSYRIYLNFLERWLMVVYQALLVSLFHSKARSLLSTEPYASPHALG